MALKYWNVIISDESDDMLLLKRRKIHEGKPVWGLLGGNLRYETYEISNHLVQEIINHGHHHVMFRPIRVKFLDFLQDENCFLFSTVVNGPCCLTSEIFTDVTYSDFKGLKKLNLAPELQNLVKLYPTIDYLISESIPSQH